MAVELTRASVDNLNRDIKQQVQKGKVQASMVTIDRLQRRDAFPAYENITSFVTSTHQKNRYKDIQLFWKEMENKPKYWAKRFIYVPAFAEGAGLNDTIAEAANMAIKIAHTQTQAYPRNFSDVGPRERSTGHLLDSITSYVNGDKVFSAGSAIRASEGAAYFELTNTAEYGSTAEARAVYVTRQQGLIFYAANKVSRKYPQLGITFNFKPVALHGLSHIYDIPVLTITSKANIVGRWARPGANIRKADRQARREASDTRRADAVIDRFRRDNLG